MGIDRTIVVALLVHAAIVAVFARRSVERTKPSAATSWAPGAPCASSDPDPTETEVTLEDLPSPRDVVASLRPSEGAREAEGSREVPGSVASTPTPGPSRPPAQEHSWRGVAATRGIASTRDPAATRDPATARDVAVTGAARAASAAPGSAPPEVTAAGVTFGGSVDVPRRVETGLDVFGARTPLSPTDGAPPNGASSGVASSGSAPSGASPAPDVDRTTAAKRALALSLRSAAREREHELGLGPEGPVLTALRSATSATTTPVTGRAVFVARANHDGLVTLLELLSCDGAREGWMAAASDAFRALQAKKLRIPSYAKLAEMTIAVSSGWKMPNGHDPGTDVTAMQVPLTRGAAGKNGTTMDILNVKIDRVRLNRDLTIPVPATRLDVVATNGDSSNLGAKPRRIVHTELLDVKLL